MEYMERNVEKRLNPIFLVENCKSVISLLYNYYTTDKLSPSGYKISKYAYGIDYHFVIKEKLRELESVLKSLDETIQIRYFVDSAPVFERFWAQQSGLGWIGKNTCLISRRHGSFFFIAEVISSLELEYDEPAADYCATCTKCIDACPTNAILPGKLIDSNKCISYQTIENKGEIDPQLKGKFNNYIFGCDICQDVCPWNRKAVSHQEPKFNLNTHLKELSSDDWHNLSQEKFNTIFGKSAVKRTKYSGLMRNIEFLRDEK